MEKRLGRGLSALLAEPRTPGLPSTGPIELALDQIRPNPFQPRRAFDAEGMKELQASIQSHGILQPVVVRKLASGYELVSGERRWRAAGAIGRTTIPAVVRQVTDEEMLELALVENLQRRDLDPIEKATGFHQLIESLGLTQEQVAVKVGLQRSTVTNHLRLLELDPEVQKAVSEGLISMGHARALLGVEDRRGQRDLCALIVRQGLSVRAIEGRVRDLRGEAAPQPVVAIPRPTPPWLRDMEARIRGHLGTKVSVRNGEGYRGQIVIEYHGREDLERVYSLLAPRVTV